MKATIYHNSQCSKSRGTFKILEEKGVKLEVIEYLKNTPTKETLVKLLDMLGIGACELMRKGELIFKEKHADKEFSDEECLEAMLADPILIERPIVVIGDRAIIGRPPENVLKLL